jgi:N-acetylmuramoyl-L-alanine amidase
MLLIAAAMAHGPAPTADWSAPRLMTQPAGTRVGVMAESDAPVELWVLADGEMVPAALHWHGDGVGVYFADLSEPAQRVQLSSPDAHRIHDASWELFEPGPREPIGGAPPPAPGVLPQELVDIGVISRADWGAAATTCSSLEDDWYRMAVHHTAGSQTNGGTVAGTVRALQSYAQGSGSYCDVPYQFLVGYDGSLWEGRPYDYYSGATGGGNNNGNIAISFLGCYDADDCGTSHAVTDAMMDAGRLLVNTLADLHDIPLNGTSIRGHRDYPDTATACPGDLLHPRLNELYASVAPRWAAALVDTSLPLGGTLTVPVGEPTDAWITLQNTGSETWSPATTLLAPLPRDWSNPLAHDSWISGGRIVGVSQSVGPGETGRFEFTLQGDAVGSVDLSLGLVEEHQAWFADDGGPAEGALDLTVLVEQDDDTGGVATDSGPIDSGGGGGVAPWPRQSFASGCSAVPGPGGVLGLLALALLWRRRG